MNTVQKHPENIYKLADILKGLFAEETGKDLKHSKAIRWAYELESGSKTKRRVVTTGVGGMSLEDRFETVTDEGERAQLVEAHYKELMPRLGMNFMDTGGGCSLWRLDINSEGTEFNYWLGFSDQDGTYAEPANIRDKMLVCLYVEGIDAQLGDYDEISAMILSIHADDAGTLIPLIEEKVTREIYGIEVKIKEMIDRDEELEESSLKSIKLFVKSRLESAAPDAEFLIY